ncbi:MAG TPA: right-handed parallel beta-helix repeat-containing protein, partial [Armatimonadota bacterium]|nr:right-handed parallel beta-helix repeat-containing protein [Armatimonadota bacterium]
RIVLLPGLYTGEATITHGGLEGLPIVIEADAPGTAVLDGRHEAKSCLSLENAPHVAIAGIEARWYATAGIYIVDSPNVAVLNCRIWNDFWMGWPTGSGVFVHRSPGFSGDRNVIFAVERGIQLLQSPRATITHNTILKNMYGAVHFIYSAEGSVSRNNSFAFSGNDQYVVITERDSELETFNSDYNNLGTMLRRPEPGDEIVPDEAVLKVGSKAVISLNSERYESLRAWREATGQDAHSIFAHPKYVDPENRDFRLQPDSPNVGAGENGVTIGALGTE